MINQKIYKALVHYIIYRSRFYPAHLGTIRLNETLWFSDLIAYQVNGDTITGETYVKRECGPEPQTIIKIPAELQDEGKIEVIQPEFKYEPTKYLSKCPPQWELIKKEDELVIEFVLDSLLGKTASEISEGTHEEIWRSARLGEEIPMFANLASGKGEISETVKAWAEQAVEGLKSQTV